MHVYQVESGSGKHRVVLSAMVTPGGIMASLAGGEAPHLGGVVVSVPRPSLANPEVISCTSSVIALVGHKDDQAAKILAELLAKETNLPVSVAAGIHVDNATSGDLAELIKNCRDCGGRLLDLLKTDFFLAGGGF